jgi:hypothetical protein
MSVTPGEPTYSDDMESIPVCDRFYIEAEAVCLGRKFFFTTRGTLGIGPACMRGGDIVVVLFGRDTP